MFINMNVSTSEDNSSRSVFFCSSSPQFIWDLKQTISLQLAIAVTAAACPFTILLNILVIVTVKNIRELQTNSNIQIANLAVADLLMGAVSVPLTITLNALIFRGTVSEDDIICTIRDITDFFLYTAYSASYYHLILIAWERYVAITKWTMYKSIVTKGRVKRYAGIAWMTALVATTLYVALAVAGVRYEVLLVPDVIFSLSWLINISLMAYFYGKVHIEIRKRNRGQISQVSVLMKTRIESKIAYTLFLLTVAVFISSVPTVVVSIVATFSPFLHRSAVFRWAEIFLQINSLVNPALYFYRNNRYRKATLKLLRFGKPREIEPTVRMVRRTRTHRDSVASTVVGALVDNERALRLRRSQSYTAETHGRTNTGRGMSAGGVMDKRMSAPSLTSHEAQQTVTLTVTVQIERAPRKKPVKGKTKLSNDENSGQKSHRRKMTRSKSLNENAVAMTRSARQTIAKVNSQRRNSAPSVLGIEIAPRKKLVKANKKLSNDGSKRQTLSGPQ